MSYLSLWDIVLVEVKEGSLESGSVVMTGGDGVQTYATDVESFT